MVYLPQGERVTVNLTKLTGPSAAAWWFDPRTADAQKIERSSLTTGVATFSPPTSGNDTDWILVIDSSRSNFPPPGASHPENSPEEIVALLPPAVQ